MWNRHDDVWIISISINQTYEDIWKFNNVDMDMDCKYDVTFKFGNYKDDEIENTFTFVSMRWWFVEMSSLNCKTVYFYFIAHCKNLIGF